jgi:hypothetical protein
MKTATVLVSNPPPSSRSLLMEIIDLICAILGIPRFGG